MKKAFKIFTVLALLVVVALLGGWTWLSNEVKAKDPSGKETLVRFNESSTFETVAKDLQGKGILKNASASTLWLKLNRKNFTVKRGTYRVSPAQDLEKLILGLKSPIRNMFRIPETNLSYRTANLLGKNDIADTEEYKSLIKQPQAFKEFVSFELPEDSLEGYLYPDTYDLPPLMGAKEVIVRQLQNWEKKVLPLVPDATTRKEVLTIASMIELEAAVDKDRPLISGVIHNRIKKNMKLEIDVTILYAMGEWRRMYNKDYKFPSPYNTYLIKGLPPGPICSPTVKSVEAALKPDTHPYLYYVATPYGYHLFSSTFDEHLKNIQKARQMKATEGAAKPK